MIADFIGDLALFPPVTLGQLTALATQFINNAKLHPDLSGWLMVEINNRIWHETFSNTPYNQRLLLLPQCLKNAAACTAEIDELGLICRRCGKCSIASLEEIAEKLDVMSLVAEGITSTNAIIGLFENGDIDAVIGVGCLESLEKSFPLLVDNAVPGMAVALNCSGCKNTTVDEDYVEKMVSEFVETQPTTSFHDYEQLKNDISQWFSTDSLTKVIDNSSDHTSLIGRDWLCGEGKRWRPYLLASVYLSITGSKHIPEHVKSAAIAVEIFHKASLIHDDIQDDDQLRYGKPTINSMYGVPIAINVGDKLLGDGYRLLAECGLMALVKEASEAHRSLCRGQGLELEWCSNPRSLTMDEVILIIENKTVPAFGVALSFAVICAGGDEELKAVLEKYAYALGMAYQLLDDMDDFQLETENKLRPTSVLAAICENCKDKKLINESLVQHKIQDLLDNNKPLLEQAMQRVTVMAETYRQQALESLAPLKNTELKRLLFRIAKKILQ